MKTFLNVLYRKILYKIPLKWLLVLLVVVALGIASFSNAENVESLITYISQGEATINGNTNLTLLNINSTQYGTYCLEISSISSSNVPSLAFGYGGTQYYYADTEFIRMHKDQIESENGIIACVFSNQQYLLLHNPYGANTQFTYKFFKLNVLLNTQLPVLTSLECQTTYNLIPISSVDSNYCTTNNLCPSCPSIPVGTGGISNVYINDILHVGAPNIYMNISEEIDRDYAYTAGGNNMNIDVVGYNVDYEKIGSIIDKQSYKPTSEDFQQIIGILGPYTKIIVFFVFLFIVWAWIKKPFKSKKL